MILSNEVLNYVAIVMAIIPPILVLYYFRNVEVRRSEKELKIATNLKEYNERTAERLRLTSINIAKELKDHLDERINNINKSIEDLNKKIEQINTSQSDISKRFDIMTSKQVDINEDHLKLIYELQNKMNMMGNEIKNIIDKLKE